MSLRILRIWHDLAVLRWLRLHFVLWPSGRPISHAFIARLQEKASGGKTSETPNMCNFPLVNTSNMKRSLWSLWSVAVTFMTLFFPFFFPFFFPILWPPSSPSGPPGPDLLQAWTNLRWCTGGPVSWHRWIRESDDSMIRLWKSWPSKSISVCCQFSCVSGVSNFLNPKSDESVEKHFKTLQTYHFHRPLTMARWLHAWPAIAAFQSSTGGLWRHQMMSVIRTATGLRQHFDTIRHPVQSFPK